MALCRLAYAHNQQYCYQGVWLARCRVWTARWLSGRWWSAERIRLFPLVPTTVAFKIHETLMDSYIQDLAAMAAELISTRMLHVRLSGNERTGTDGSLSITGTDLIHLFGGDAGIRPMEMHMTTREFPKHPLAMKTVGTGASIFFVEVDKEVWTILLMTTSAFYPRAAMLS